MVYITSDLFGSASTHGRGDTATPTYWTSMADSPHPAGLGKRKRLEGDEGPNPSCMHQQRPSPSSRSYARLHAHNTTSFEINRNLSYPAFSASPLFSALERRPVKQIKRLSPKASLIKSTSHLMDVDLDLTPPKPETHSHAVIDLRSCHACKSAPKRRKDLENYLDCRRCEGRTCYICARQCFGGCGKAVCKKCIVEVGEEGDPWCLDCYARNLNS
ncbi:hypothetical protein CC86DRAFT_342459 [Ophiobolus disseminans]|uniref:Uncharacterized protein n=1 Tax=Ophiobolus disseminans TaxID=1469910 RepID=A0A6A7AE98_9PLEO|nr:hypothetical protein CC86DRAFT_342459 [Ophiobolus disseminans]